MVTHSPQITTTERVQVDRRYLRLKSTLDWLLALILLIVLAPIMLFIALLIRLDSRGPACYRQQRVGQGKQPFTILKFRTMRSDTPDLSTEEMQRRGLNPVTRVGKVLRKTSLDELPQLLNILRGEMSFIGPRPALPSQVDVNTRRELFGVHQVRPGITGLAQVMGRDDLDTDTKVNYDADYCRRMSLWFDARLIIMTFAAIISSHGNK